MESVKSYELREVYFSLGTDIGDREGNLLLALEKMNHAFGVPYSALSSFIETEPWGFESDTRFLNCAVMYRLGMPCAEILKSCQSIEIEMGRKAHCPEYGNDGQRIYRSRIIDIDILLYGDEMIATETLTVPHPLMAQRDFVMIPLMQIVSHQAVESFPDVFQNSLNKRK